MKVFPIMGDKYGVKRGYVPLEFMRRCERRAMLNHGGQTIEELAKRGGLTPQEAMAVVQDAPWQERRWHNDEAAWSNLQLIVSAEYPSFNLHDGSVSERQNQPKDTDHE